MGAEKIKCAIISGAPEISVTYYKEYLSDRFIICADSGYLKCNALGIVPDVIIGDFDSAPLPDTKAEVIVLPVRKDDTDTLSCAKYALEQGFKDIIILGGIGDRADHTLSNIRVVFYCIKNGAECALINSKNRITYLCESSVIKKKGYKYFSLFAAGGTVQNLTVSGAEYNVNNITMTAEDMFAQSNEFVNDVNISFDSGRILLIESND